MNIIENTKLMECIYKHMANSTFLGVESLDDFYKRAQESSSHEAYLHIDTQWGVVKPSRTVKVIASDDFECVTCNKKALYVSYQRSADIDKVYSTFWIASGDAYMPLTKDHIVAKSLGGTDAFENLQTLCYKCNQDKADSIVVGTDGKKRTVTIKKTIDNMDYKAYRRKVSHFKYVRKKINKIRKNLPWYYRILGVGRYFDQNLVKPMQDKGYFIDGDE